MVRGRAPRHRNHDNIGRHRFRHRHLPGRKARVHGRAVVEHHLHVEPVMAAPGNRPADPAHADDAHALAGHMGAQHLHRTPAFPRACAQQPFSFAQAPGGHQDQAKRDIGRGVRHGAGGVGDHHSGSLGRVDVDVVVAHPEVGQQFRPGCRHIGKDIRLEPVAQGGQDGVKVAQRGPQFVGRQRVRPVAQGDVEPRARGVQHAVGQAAGDQKCAHQNSLPPSGTSWPGPISTTSPFASGTPSTRTSDSTGPIWRGGKFTTASTWRPTSPSGV